MVVLHCRFKGGSRARIFNVGQYSWRDDGSPLLSKPSACVMCLWLMLDTNAGDTLTPLGFVPGRVFLGILRWPPTKTSRQACSQTHHDLLSLKNKTHTHTHNLWTCFMLTLSYHPVSVSGQHFKLSAYILFRRMMLSANAYQLLSFLYSTKWCDNKQCH